MRGILHVYRRVHAGLTMAAVAIPVGSKALAIQFQTTRLPTVARDGGSFDVISRIHSLITGDHATERRRLRLRLSACFRLSRRRSLRPASSPRPASTRLGVAETQQRSGHRRVRFVRRIRDGGRRGFMSAGDAGEGSCERRARYRGERVAVGVVLDRLLNSEAAALGESCHRRLRIRTDGESVQLEGETGDGVGWRDGLRGWEEEGLGEGVGRNAFEEGMIFLLPAGEAFGLRSRPPHGHFSGDERRGGILPFLGGRRRVGLRIVSTTFSIGERNRE